MKKDKLETADDVIDAAGGTTKVAARFQVSIPAVCQWRRRGKLPPRTFSAWQQILSAMGKSAPPSLWRQEAR